MEEFDLKTIWRNSEEKAKAFYQEVEPEVLEMAHKKSNNLLQEIKRNAINETITGLLLLIGVVYFFRDHPYVWILYLCTVLLVFSSYMSTRKFIHEIKSVSTYKMVESIGGYLNILTKALNKLKFQVWIFVPISFVLGMLACLTENGNDLGILTRWDGLLLTIGISVQVLYGLLWFVSKKYIFLLYEKPIIELKKLHDDLISQDENLQ